MGVGRSTPRTAPRPAPRTTGTAGTTGSTPASPPRAADAPRAPARAADAPVEARRSTPSAASREEASVRHGADVRAGAMRSRVEGGAAPSGTTGTAGTAPATRTESGAPVLSDTRVSVRSEAGARAVLADTPQVNDVSERAGTSQAICGGAAVTSAMLLSGNPEANAGALRHMSEGGRSPEETTALDHLAEGSVSPRDVAYLQQLNYRLGAAGAGHPLTEGGAPYLMRPSDMGRLTADIQNNGGMPGAHDVRYDEVHRPGPPEYDHWTATVGHTTVDSMAPGGGASVGTAGAAPTPRDPNWQGSVALTTTAGGSGVINIDSRDPNADPSDLTATTRAQMRRAPGTGDWSADAAHQDRIGHLDPAGRAEARRAIEGVMHGRSSDDLDADDVVCEALRNNPHLLDYATTAERQWFNRAVTTDDMIGGDEERAAARTIEPYLNPNVPSLED